MISVHANGLRFAVHEAVESGDRGLALCLHGFPELGYSWRHQLPMLARLGYRAWAPDLRGYGATERPPHLRDYAIETLMDDVTGLIEAAGERSATIIAHDWGGLIAWFVAMHRPEVVDRFCVMNLPHPKLLAREVRHGDQLRRSLYVLAFQVPGLAERLLAADEYRRIENAFTTMAVDPTRFSDDDLRIYREAAAQPGALRAMFSYYRAHVVGLGGHRMARRGYPIVQAPTLMIWGEQDTALGKATTVGTDALCRDLVLRYVPDASHWVQQEAPETVNAMLEAWLTEAPVPQAWEVTSA